MKKLIAIIGTYTCFYLGDLIGRPMYRKGFSFLYDVYQRLMKWSLNIQDWGGLSHPWKHPKN
jgi:membrane protein DedA with SNARE-associated domain